LALLYSEVGQNEMARSHAAEALKSAPNCCEDFLKENHFKNKSDIEYWFRVCKKAGLIR
jgi:hypothetical protein